ncbi:MULTISPECIES: DUF1367 family protein [Snodgrassella]|uniref:DUF1367 family protein n=1 Tax=Snodgrassella TaxID=1193515 RepID=UPI0009FE81F6|nr:MULTISPECIES: DUF1367 family protein [Snodgrassella]MBI0159373.1 DUF1367 family protein [Snodgrassella sp. W6238H11]MBI0161459.1 DUF1367 family protein [Snodgrassella sp. W6238H14]MBI0181197.1 DUF1367 family protein [Snodgrassella sp. W8158]ORF33006.1 hypothetical protein BGI09_02480 [Snodgrassella alvi]
MELVAVKAIDNSLRPVTAIDADSLKQVKIGQPVKIQVTRQKDRSLPHHRLFFGGLLPFAFDYWQPAGGVISPKERDVVLWIAKRLDKFAGNKGIIVTAAEEALNLLAKKRAEKLLVIDKDINSFRRWLTIEAGYFNYRLTPAGVVKEPKSISFASMDQDEFNAFYKACFNVCWNMILCNRFSSEDEAQQAIDQLLSLGN